MSTHNSIAESINSSITKVESGLVASDSLRNGDLDKHHLRWLDNHGWNFDRFNTHEGSINFYENSVHGLYLGVKAQVEGDWGGLYATTNNSASLFHAVLTMPYNSTKDQFNTGLKVSTSKGPISYVSCLANANPRGITWSVQYSHGNLEKAERFETLWSSNTSKNQPLTRDCTIITNGDNYLKVYLDNNLVFLSDRLELKMSQPFRVFLEVTTPSASQYLYGTFKDYYSTSGENVSIINAPVNGSVKIIETKSKKVLADGVAGTDGIASINIGQYHFPLNAQIQVYNSDNNLVTSTPSNVNLFGGDVYLLAT